VRNLEVRLSSKNRVKEADSIKVPALTGHGRMPSEMP
jgi:hypothetical protein